MTEKHYEEFDLDLGSQETPPLEFTRDCPACGVPNTSERVDCQGCGIVFSKMREPRPLTTRGMGDARTRQSIDWGGLARKIAPVVLLGAAAFAVWFFVLRATYATVGAPIGEGRVTVVLMHGFGAPADALVPRAEALSARLPDVTWVLPAGPHGARTGNAWVVGPKEAEARASALQSEQAIRALLAELAEAGVDPSTIYLGGYAQGAQMALDFALASDAPDLAGLILLSGGIPSWADARTLKTHTLKGGARVFIAHGNHDTIVPIAQAARMRAQLFEANVPVTFHTAPGGHAVEPATLDALVAWLGQ